jgi:hypothetical protein
VQIEPREPDLLIDEPISPELVLVDPDLRERVQAREALPVHPSATRRIRRPRLLALTTATTLVVSALAVTTIALTDGAGADARTVPARAPITVRLTPVRALSVKARPKVRPSRKVAHRPARHRRHRAKPKSATPFRETEPTSGLIGPLPDPTPPRLRLRPTAARALLAVSARRHVDWARLLAAARAHGLRWTTARPSQLRPLVRRLKRERRRHEAPSAKEIAFARYHRAVGLDALVSGLGAARSVLGARVLRNPRVAIYAGGRSDIARGRVDPRVLAVLLYLAQAEGSVAVSSLVSDHVPPGNGREPSAHAFGVAVDLRAVAGRPVLGHQGVPGPVERTIRELLLLPHEVRPLEVISLLGLGGPSVALADHDRFVHVGFDPTVAPDGNGNLPFLWRTAGAAYGVPWQVLAAVNEIETGNGEFLHVSSAGALGWMQFMPGTWLQYGLDADGNGTADPWNPTDAIFAAARYLAAAGAGSDLSRAIWAYNHAQWYVDDVLARARRIGLAG